MKHLLTLLAFAAVVLVLSLGLMGADGTLINSAGTTTTGGGAAPLGFIFTNGLSVSGTVSNDFTVDPTHKLFTSAITNSTTITVTPGAGSFSFLATGFQVGANMLIQGDYHTDRANSKSYFDFSQASVGITALNRVAANVNLSIDANSIATSDLQWWRSAAQTIRAKVDTNGTFFAQGFTATNGLASFSTTAGATIDATGWTNTFGINATVYVTATAVAWTIKNRANSTIYTSPTLTATVSVHLQPGWSVNAASGLAGTALPD